jgi:hypothetical protein
MPDLRFAIGAVLACALLIVAVFGLAATVQMAHHRSATRDDPWRTLAYPDPTDWGLLADRSRPATLAKGEIPEVPQASVAITAPSPETAGAIKPSEREVPQSVVSQSDVPQSEVPQGLVPQEAEAAEGAEQPALDTTPATIVAAAPPPAPAQSPVAAPEQEPEPVDVVAAIPESKADPIQPAGIPPAIKGPADDEEPLESSERVAALPGFPTAGHGFVPPEHPLAQRVPLPPSKPAIKKPQKRKVVRSRPRWLSAPPPFANTGYPLFGSDKFGADNKSAKTTGYDKMWTAE